jgi:hypothetical protein
MKFTIIFISACLFLVGGVSTLVAEETWQGNAAVSLRGELDRDGYYAASNSFPPGTKILVTNLANSRTVVVTIRQRLDGASNVFLLLSSRASTELGMNPTDIARIKTQVVGISTDLTGGVTDFTYNKDVDTNPAYGTPDMTTIVPDKTTTLAETTPTPIPSPSPTPYTDTIVTDNTAREPEKDRFAVPSTEQSADVSQRHAPAAPEEERLGGFEMADARIPIREKAQAVYITRPNVPKNAERTAAVKPDEPLVAKSQKAVETATDRARVDEYTAHRPQPEDVVAILIEPTEQVKTAETIEEGTVTVFERPTLDQETVTAALNDPELMAADRPFVWELHDVRPAGESLALAEPVLPELSRPDQASVDTFVKSAPTRDRVALDSFDLPELTGKEKAEINALAKAEPPEEKVTAASPRLPEARGREKPDVLQRADVQGRDKKSVDLALVPAEPKTVVKPRGETRTTTITVVPDKTRPDTATIKVEPDTTGPVITTIWDTTDYSKNFYYLQLGVFASRDTAEKILRANPTYPMMIQSGRSDNATVYKVVVGPLKRDETGTVLYLFKARGYRDAFLRYIE